MDRGHYNVTFQLLEELLRIPIGEHIISVEAHPMTHSLNVHVMTSGETRALEGCSSVCIERLRSRNGCRGDR